MVFRKKLVNFRNFFKEKALYLVFMKKIVSKCYIVVTEVKNKGFILLINCVILHRQQKK